MHTFRAHAIFAITIFYGTLFFIFTAIFSLTQHKPCTHISEIRLSIVLQAKAKILSHYLFKSGQILLCRLKFMHLCNDFHYDSRNEFAAKYYWKQLNLKGKQVLQCQIWRTWNPCSHSITQSLFRSDTWHCNLYAFFTGILVMLFFFPVCLLYCCFAKYFVVDICFVC